LRGLNCSQPELIGWVEFSRPTYCGIPAGERIGYTAKLWGGGCGVICQVINS